MKTKDYREIEMRFKQYRSRVWSTTRDRLRETAKAIVEDMKDHLLKNGNIDTGALYDSCRYRTYIRHGEVIVRIYAEAASDVGTKYAEFIEFGTGIYNEHGDGRQDKWRYQDRDGNWHTTEGSRPHPFIRPAWAAHEHELQKLTRETLRIEDTRHEGGW